MVKVKICGITNLDDALSAAEYGADALGFIFYEKSPRCITPPEAISIIRNLPPFITKVGVFVDESMEKVRQIKYLAGLDAVQLHGDETPDMCGELGTRVIKAFRVGDQWPALREQLLRFKVDACLLDTYRKGLSGGTGEVFDWETAVKAKKYGRVILAGGLNPDNVSKAVDKVRPYAVDVASGVENKPGKKDIKKVKEFIERAKRV